MPVDLAQRLGVRLGQGVEASFKPGYDESVACPAGQLFLPGLPQSEELAKGENGARLDDLGQDMRFPEEGEAAAHPALLASRLQRPQPPRSRRAVRGQDRPDIRKLQDDQNREGGSAGE
jgi:hypothetical protein